MTDLGVDGWKYIQWLPLVFPIVEVTTGRMQPRFVHRMRKGLFIHLNGLSRRVCLLAFKCLGIERCTLGEQAV